MHFRLKVQNKVAFVLHHPPIITVGIRPQRFCLDICIKFIFFNTKFIIFNTKFTNFKKSSPPRLAVVRDQHYPPVCTKNETELK